MSKNISESPYATPAAIIAAALMIVAALVTKDTPASAAAPAAQPVKAVGAGCGV